MQSWDCSACTFRHQANAPRCVMCNELRVSRESMRDFIIGKSTTTPANHQPKSSASATSNPLTSIDNVISNHTSVVNTAPTSSGIMHAENPPSQAAAPRTSLATLTRNPYCSNPSRLSKGTLPSMSTGNQTNNQLHPPPQQQSTTVQPASVLAQSVCPSIGDASTKPSAKLVVPSTTNKRPRSLSIVPSNKKVRKRPKSLTNAIVLPYQPGPVLLAIECADTWIYPVVAAYPKRQYQYDITCAAIKQNTLVSLPTGLGKTLIAAVVLYNFYRWYPTGKVLFLAPTLPLVDQQVQACYEIMGIPASDTALLTGKVPAVQLLRAGSAVI